MKRIIGRFSVAVLAVALSLSILIVGVFAEEHVLSIASSDFGSCYSNLFLDGYDSVLFNMQQSFSHNVPGYPVDGAQSYIYPQDGPYSRYLGVWFDLVEFGSNSIYVFQPDYTYKFIFTFRINGSCRPGSGSTPPSFLVAPLSYMLSPHTVPSNSSLNSLSETTFYDLGDLPVANFTESSIPSITTSQGNNGAYTYAIDYGVTVVFKLPSDAPTNLRNFCCVSEWSPDLITLNGADSTNAFQASGGVIQSVEGYYDPDGSVYEDASAEIIAMQQAQMEQQHQDAEAIKGAVESGFGQLGDLINGDGSTPESEAVSQFDDAIGAENDLLMIADPDQILGDFDMQEVILDELDWGNIDIPDQSSGDVWHNTLNPIFSHFSFFVAFPCIVGLLATLLGRRKS